MARRLREELHRDLMEAAVRLSGLPAAADRPTVEVVSPALLAATVCPDDPASCRALVAVYDTDRVRVLLRDTVDLRDAIGQSFLVHEFVHHLQHRARGAALVDRCEAVVAAEQQAYAVQNRFLERERQAFRAGEMLRSLQCPTEGASGTGAATAPTVPAGSLSPEGVRAAIR